MCLGFEKLSTLIPISWLPRNDPRYQTPCNSIPRNVVACHSISELKRIDLYSNFKMNTHSLPRCPTAACRSLPAHLPAVCCTVKLSDGRTSGFDITEKLGSNAELHHPCRRSLRRVHWPKKAPVWNGGCRRRNHGRGETEETPAAPTARRWIQSVSRHHVPIQVELLSWCALCTP